MTAVDRATHLAIRLCLGVALGIVFVLSLESF